MSSLQTYIKSQPPQPLSAWAVALGVSRPMLYGLLDGTRGPSIETAKRIDAATGGAVKWQDWPNIAGILAEVDRGAA
jgi:DNA-binding transcriptional regulator YdaS (Cro superfamily)